MQSLFQVWDAFAAELKAAPHVLLLSDYDGTLTPIVSRPEEALLSPDVREKLSLLTRKAWLSIGIVSGRPLSEIQKMVGIPGINYAGNHGFEIEGPGLSFVSPVATSARKQMRKIVPLLRAKLGGIAGIIIEDKGLGLSVHYRLVKEREVARAGTVFRQITEPLMKNGEIRVTSGKKVWEIRPPVDWHKGKAVATIRAEIQKTLKLTTLPAIYAGDDTTDEDAFRVVCRPEGWGIYVGGENPTSAAEYFLDSPADVTVFLSRLGELK